VVQGAEVEAVRIWTELAARLVLAERVRAPLLMTAVEAVIEKVEGVIRPEGAKMS